MSQIHAQTAMVQDTVVSEFGLYDAGWLATCVCGTDVWLRQGHATLADTQAVMDTHLRNNGITPAPFTDVRPVVYYPN